MAKRVEKIFKASRASNVPRIHIEQRHTIERKATNQEVIRDAFTMYGHVKLNVQIRIQSTSGQYVGFNGTGFTLTAPDEESVKAFPEQLRAAAARVAEGLGMKATRRIVPL